MQSVITSVIGVGMEMVEQIILAMGLFINAILDIKKRQISVLVVLLMAIFEIGYKFYYDLILFPECILSIIPGLIMIIISFFSEQSIGYGDGLLVMCLGLYMMVEQILFIGIISVTIAGVFAIILVIFGHKKKNYEIPFVPFMVIGYGMMKGMI